MDRQAKILGGCMCGAIRYACSGEPLHVGYCHCRSCRHHSGAALAGMLVFEPENIEFTAGDLSIYASSSKVERGFCSQCGTSLTWSVRGLMSIHIGTLDNPDEHPPRLHWRYDERSPWCDAGRDLPAVELLWPEQH